MQSYAALRPTCMPCSQNWSRMPCDTFEPGRLAPKNGRAARSRKSCERSASDLGPEVVEHLDRDAARVVVGLQHQRRDRADEHHLATRAVPWRPM